MKQEHKDKDWVPVIEFVIGLIIIGILFAMMYETQTCDAQELRSNNGRIEYRIEERNDGSKVVKDNKGRIVRIIRERNDGRTVYHEADGRIRGIENPNNQRDSLRK